MRPGTKVGVSRHARQMFHTAIHEDRMTDLARLEKLLERIDRRLSRLEDVEAIKRLIVDYARGADHGNDPAMLAPLFTEDAVWEAKGFGRWEGRDKVVAFLKAVAGDRVWWSLHFMISPKIDVAADGRSARLIWYLWEPATLRDEETGDPEPYWITGVYESDAVRTEAGWKFKRIFSGMNVISPAKEGWVKQRFLKGGKTMPYFVQLDAGTYYWCACGKSKNQPFCDGSHKGTKSTPVEFTLDRFDLVALCGCKMADTKPFCDGKHMGLEI